MCVCTFCPRKVSWRRVCTLHFFLSATVGNYVHIYLTTFNTGATWINYLSVNEMLAAVQKERPSRRDLTTLAAVLKTLENKNDLGDADQIAFLKESKFAAVERGLAAYLAVAGKPKPAIKLPAKPLDDKTRAALRPHLVKLAESIDRFEQPASRTAAPQAWATSITSLS